MWIGSEEWRQESIPESVIAMLTGRHDRCVNEIRSTAQQLLDLLSLSNELSALLGRQLIRRRWWCRKHDLRRK